MQSSEYIGAEVDIGVRRGVSIINVECSVLSDGSEHEVQETKSRLSAVTSEENEE